MMTTRRSITALCVTMTLLVTGCASTTSPPSHDYSAFLAARPASILVLPPVNNTPDVAATNSMWSHATLPLAESGYYVFPATLVQQTFRQNGMTIPEEIQKIPAARLRQIFGADTALYITVSDYGTTYMVLDSQTRVTATAKLVDLRSGRTLWTGSATASSSEGSNNNNGNLIGMLITAAVKQVVNTVSDKGYDVAGITSSRMLSAGGTDGDILKGPHSPAYKDNLKNAQAATEQEKKQVKDQDKNKKSSQPKEKK